MGRKLNRVSDEIAVELLNKALTIHSTVATTTAPTIRPVFGIGIGVNVIGNAAAGVMVGAMLQVGEGEITRLAVEDPALREALRATRQRKVPARATAAAPAATK